MSIHITALFNDARLRITKEVTTPDLNTYGLNGIAEHVLSTIGYTQAKYVALTFGNGLVYIIKDRLGYSGWHSVPQEGGEHMLDPRPTCIQCQAYESADNPMLACGIGKVWEFHVCTHCWLEHVRDNIKE